MAATAAGAAAVAEDATAGSIAAVILEKIFLREQPPSAVQWHGRVGVEAFRLTRVNCSCRIAPVAQLDRAVASGATGREFESLRAHHVSPR